MWQLQVCQTAYQLVHALSSTEDIAHVCRVKSYHQRSAQYDQILKKNEQMYALLAITTSLCPAATRNLDEAVANMLKEK